MSRIGIVVMGLVALALLAYGVYPSFVSDETKIRWRIEELVDAFNDQDAVGVVEPLHVSYLDSSGEPRIDRTTLQRLLLYWFARDRDAKTKGFPYRIEVPGEGVTVSDLDAAAGKANVELTARLSRLRDGEPEAVWEVRVTGEIARDPQLGWQLIRTEHETVAGGPPR